jgi:hypothetical protein
MAIIIVKSEQGKQVGIVNFFFLQSDSSYIFVNGAKIGIEGIVHDSKERKICSLICSYNGNDSFCNLTPVGKSFPSFGEIQVSREEVRIESLEWRNLGNVIGNDVRNENKRIIGELFYDQDNEYKDYPQQFIQDCEIWKKLSTIEAQNIFDRQYRPFLIEKMMLFAGKSALILGLFRNK